MVIYCQTTFYAVIVSKQKLDNGTFATAGFAHQGADLAVLEVNIDSPEHWLVGLVVEVHPSQRDVFYAL